MSPTVPFLDLTGMTSAVRDSVFASWSELVADNRFVGGQVIEDFESRWAAYCQTPFAVGVANGTDALELVLRALDIGPGDEVVIPANSFVATAEAVALTGATPRFADVDPDTLLMTADCLDEAITARTTAAIAVHLYGQLADMDALVAVAQRHGIHLIEDAVFGGMQQFASLRKLCARFLKLLECTLAGDGFNTPHACGNAALIDDLQ